MDKKEVIVEYNKIYFQNRELARKLIKKLDFKNDHELLNLIAQSYVDEARFTNTGENRNPYDRKKLRYAERYIMQAFNICPTCSNVLWTLAKVRTDYGQHKAAIFCYQDIIKLGVKGITKDTCKNQFSIIQAQINDSKFQLYRLYHKKNSRLSRRYLAQYKEGIKEGISTLFKPLSKFLLPELIGR